MLNDLDTAFGKSVHPGCPREAQNPRDLLGALIFRIDDLGKAHGIAQKGHLVQIQRVPDPGDHVFGPQLSGRNAADHIHFILFRRGHHKVRRADAGAAERLRIGGVSLHADDVEVVRHLRDGFGVQIDDGDVVLLFRENRRHGAAYLACTGNDDFHCRYPPMSKG